MIIQKLWPTTVYRFTFDQNICNMLHASIISYSAQDIPPEDMNKQGLFNIIADAIKVLGTVDIADVWIRETVVSSNNNFEIHSDSHKGTDLIGILWLTGNENCGGDIVLYDPAWRNPQRMRYENQQQYNIKQQFNFKIGELILFPSNVWHEVTSYYGTEKRISLNFAINIDGLNN